MFASFRRKVFFSILALLLLIITISIYLKIGGIAALTFVSVIIVFELLLQYFVRKFALPNGAAALFRVPCFPESLVKKFIAHGYDPELGWIRKPNTKKTEFGKQYIIDASGSRHNPAGIGLSDYISTYGDSYTFCREVADDETWQYYLSKNVNQNVKNFGVGNYGFDQALLRLKREYNESPTPIVIIGIVPQTIARILSTWKHFNEFGNILAFKPRFYIKNGNLKLQHNFIDKPDKFFSVRKYLPDIIRYDYFYTNKFEKESFSFPFLFSIIYSPRRFVLILCKTLRNIIMKITGSKKILNFLDELVFWAAKSEGAFQSKKLFEENSAVKLFELLVSEFINFSKEKDFIPVLLFMPMKDDIAYISKHKHYYNSFINEIKEKLLVIDATPSFLNKGRPSSFFRRWHYNNDGNKVIADLVSDKIHDEVCSFNISKKMV